MIELYLPSANVTTILSNEDLDYVSSFDTWCLSGWGYLFLPNPTEYLHVLIAKRAGFYESNKIVDHRNRKKLDNSRTNLRMVTRSIQMHNFGIRSTNKSGVKGVHWDSGCGKWRVQITIDRKKDLSGRLQEERERHPSKTSSGGKIWRTLK